MDRGIAPITPLRETTAVKRGDHHAPTCEHGEWTFAGADRKRQATRWRCPTGRCTPASRRVKADRVHPLIPRETPRFRALYKQRGAVEREFGRLTHDWALAPLRTRGIDRVRLHADLTILTKLACALARTRAVPLAASTRRLVALASGAGAVLPATGRPVPAAPRNEMLRRCNSATRSYGSTTSRGPSTSTSRHLASNVGS
jgi:transposase